MKAVFVLLVTCTHGFRTLRRPLVPPRQRQGLTLATPQPQDGADSAPSIALFAAVPVGALILQGLYVQKLLLPLLLVKRVFIYAMATYVVAVGGARGGADPSALGTRLESLTREVLPDSLAPTTDLAPLQKLDAVY